MKTKSPFGTKKILTTAIIASLTGCLGSSNNDTSTNNGFTQSSSNTEAVNSSAVEPRNASSYLTQLRNAFAASGTVSNDIASNNPAQIVNGDSVLLTVTATANTALTVKNNLESLGMTNISQYKHLISGSFPIKDLAKLDNINGVSWITSSKAKSKAVGGIAYNAADIALFTDTVKKQYSLADNITLDGTGIKVGVISDSFNCLGTAGDDALSGDLPNVTILKEYSYCSTESGKDEGRAMIQLIHDIAPGADLLFHTGFESPVNFALGIQALTNAGADIIVDDIGWLTMPMFQEGPIAQAVNEAKAKGVLYFSAAGNAARLSYEKSFTAGTNNGEVAHDFGLAAGLESDLYQKITVPQNVDLTIVLQWDDPAQISGGLGAKTDLDMILLDSSMERIIATSQDNNIGHDPVEMLQISSTSFGEGVAEANLYIKKSAGENPSNIKYVIYSSAPIDITTNKVIEVEQLHFQGKFASNNIDANGVKTIFEQKFIKPDGTALNIEEVEAVIKLPDLIFFSGDQWLADGLLKIGKGGVKIQQRDSDGAYGVIEGSNFFIIDTEYPIWLIPENFDATLNADGTTIELSVKEGTIAQTDVRITEYNTQSSTLYGHPNASGAITVGAMPYKNSPWFPQGSQRIEVFSSAGGTPIRFDINGNPQVAEYRAKPEIISIDDVDTTFFGADNLETTDSDGNGFPNFRGTSAAAPNAAAVAALLLQKYPHLTPDQVKTLFMKGAVDLNDPIGIASNDTAAPTNSDCGTQFDWGTGCGLIQAHTIFSLTEDSNGDPSNLVEDIRSTVTTPTGTIDFSDTETGEAGTPIARPADVVTVIQGDFNEDGCVDTSDNSMLIASIRFGSTDQTFDLTGDSRVNDSDLAVMTGLLSSNTACQ